MSDGAGRGHSVSEAAAAAYEYGAGGAEALRQRLEGFDGWLREERHRVVEREHEGERVLCLELWVRDYSDIRARYEARRRQQPHPPTQFMWLTQLRFPIGREWSETEIEEAMAEVADLAEGVEDGHGLAGSHDPAPPGYEHTDYDFQDWFMDFRYGLWWLHKP